MVPHISHRRAAAASQRAALRHYTAGLMVSLWDGQSSCIGIIEDVSSRGLRVSQVPILFDDRSLQCCGVVHGPQHDLTLRLRSCWRLETRPGMYKMIGFQLVFAPVGWLDFLRERGNYSDLFNAKTPETAWRDS